MEDIFIKILNMSITASYFAVALIIISAFFRKMPKWLSCILWGLVGLRLILPFSFESILSLIPSAQTVPSDIMMSKEPHITSGIPALNSAVNPIISESFTPEPSASANPLQIIVFILSAVWVAGVIGMFIYAFVSYILIRRKTAESIETEKGIFICDNIDTPFILGVIRPKIYIPSFIGDENKALILAHEKAHLKRFDHIWKPFAFLILSVYWFNPVMWAVFVLLCRDIEAACDEKVIKEMDTKTKKSYSEALITCSAPKQYITACPLAFGETGVKYRIKNVLNYKKPAFRVIIIAVIVSIVLSVCFMTNPSGTGIDDIQGYKEIFKDVEKLQFKLPESFTYTTEDPWSELRVLKKVKIDAEAVSDDRSTDRASTYKIEINDKYTIYIDESFSQLWLDDKQSISLNINLTGSSNMQVDDGKLPSLTYRIQNSENLKKLFEEIYTPQSPVIGTETSPLFTDFDGVYLTLKSIDTNPGGYKVFNLIWNNTTDIDITYGEFYDIEIKNGDNWESVAEENIAFSDIGYTLKADSTEHKKYTTQRFDISKKGEYRLITDFSVNDGKSYKTYVEFQITDGSGDISDIGGVSGPITVITTKKLTLDDVKELSKKGDSLVWEDFAAYSSVETSFGGYSRHYEIDEMFYVTIASERSNTKPIYIRLNTNDGSGLYIDIRTEDVDAFIENHKDNPVIKNVPFNYITSPVEYNEGIYSKIIEIGGIPSKIALSSINVLPKVKITSLRELENFIEKMKDVTDLSKSAPSFMEYARGYTEKHFENNTLFIVYAEADSSDSDFKIEFLTNSRETLTIGIMEFASNNPDNKRTGYFILVDVMNEHTENAKHTDAVLSSTIYPEQYISDGQIIRTYTFEDSQQEIFKPNFSLYEDGRFVFNFSPLSSYFATGKYTIEEGKIILRTNDGRYTYCFNEQNDTYVFDSSSSSDTLFTDITDGAIFY